MSTPPTVKIPCFFFSRTTEKEQDQSAPRSLPRECGAVIPPGCPRHGGCKWRRRGAVTARQQLEHGRELGRGSAPKQRAARRWWISSPPRDSSPVVDAPWTHQHDAQFRGRIRVQRTGDHVRRRGRGVTGAPPNGAVIANPIILSAPATAFTNLSLRFTGPVSGAGSLAVAGGGRSRDSRASTPTAEARRWGPACSRLGSDGLGPVVVSNGAYLGRSFPALGGPVVVPGPPSPPAARRWASLSHHGGLHGLGLHPDRNSRARAGPPQYTGITVTGSVDLTRATLVTKGR